MSEQIKTFKRAIPAAALGIILSACSNPEAANSKADQPPLNPNIAAIGALIEDRERVTADSVRVDTFPIDLSKLTEIDTVTVDSLDGSQHTISYYATSQIDEDPNEAIRDVHKIGYNYALGLAFLSPKIGLQTFSTETRRLEETTVVSLVPSTTSTRVVIAKPEEMKVIRPSTGEETRGITYASADKRLDEATSGITTTFVEQTGSAFTDAQIALTESCQAAISVRQNPSEYVHDSDVVFQEVICNSFGLFETYVIGGLTYEEYLSTADTVRTTITSIDGKTFSPFLIFSEEAFNSLRSGIFPKNPFEDSRYPSVE